MAAKEKATFEPSAQTRDLEARAERDNESFMKVGQAQGPQVNPGPPAFEGDGNSEDVVANYVGVDPIYQNYANETEAPLVGDGIEDQLHEQFVENLDPQPEAPVAEEDEPSEEDTGGGESTNTSDAGGTSKPPSSS